MVRFFRIAALASVGIASPALAQAPKTTPTPRVLVRMPFGAPAAQQDAVVAKVAAAIKEAGALSIKQQDFANAAGGREEVKQILQSARANLTQASGHLGKKSYRDAVISLEKAVADYESIGSELWRASELSYAYLKLGLARWKRDGKAGPDAVEAFRRARTLDPKLDLIEFEDDEIAVFKKGAAGAQMIPAPPGEGFYSLARVMGLDGLVEVRVDKGIYSLRVHRISPVNVKSTKVASKTVGLDAGAKQGLRAALSFDPTAPVATPTLVAVATPTPAPTVTPIPGREVAWESSLPSPTPTPVFFAAPTATPTPAPTVVAVAPTPKPNGNGNGSRNGNPNGRTPRPTPTPDEEEEVRSIDDVPATGPKLASNTSWAALVGGVDRRAALYAGTEGFTSVPSGYGGSAQLRTWIGLGKWAIAANGGAMQRSYLVSEATDTVKSGTAIDAGVHVLRSDDAEGTWWIGAGTTYVSEPGINDPGGSVPEVTRLSPGVTGLAQFRMGSKLALRVRGTAGVGLEMGTGQGFGDGVGYDVAGEASASFALTQRLKLAAGVGAHRLYTEFAEKQTSVEARQSAWLGIEAGF